MPRGLEAPLSYNEEVALRRVASGRSPLQELAPRDVMRLKTLSLVEDENGTLKLTEIGRQRYRALPRTSQGDEKTV